MIDFDPIKMLLIISKVMLVKKLQPQQQSSELYDTSLSEKDGDFKVSNEIYGAYQRSFENVILERMTISKFKAKIMQKEQQSLNQLTILFAIKQEYNNQNKNEITEMVELHS